MDFPDTEVSGGESSPSWISSATSSSISVVSVPFDVTGDGPTISLGEVIWRPFGDKLSSIEYGRRLEDSAELRADLQFVSWCCKVDVGGLHWFKTWGAGLRWRVGAHGEVGIGRKGRH